MKVSLTCRCERGLMRAADCWLNAETKPDVPSVEAGPINGIEGSKNPQCYASSLGYCSPKLSREHYYSHNILREIESTGQLLAKGFPWLNGKTQNLPSQALTSKVLCTNHNSRLSPLDDFAGSLFESLTQFELDLVNCKGPSVCCRLFNGLDFERWLLKAMCGMGASGNWSSQGQPLGKCMPTETILAALFTADGPHLEYGLYYTKVDGDPVGMRKGFELAPLTSGTQIIGAQLNFYGLHFTLTLVNPSELQIDSLKNATHRPLAITLENEFGCRRGIRFCWPYELHAASS